MICTTCDGTGEGMSEYAGRCAVCKGKGEVPDVCDICGEERPCNDDMVCRDCWKLHLEAIEEDENEEEDDARE